MGAIKAGFTGRRLEEKVSSVLVKGYKKGDKPEGTIKHMCVIRIFSHSLFSIALVTESDEFFELMIKVMRHTSQEGMDFGHLIDCYCLKI